VKPIRLKLSGPALIPSRAINSKRPDPWACHTSYPCAVSFCPRRSEFAFPPLGNEFIIVLKGTSLASVIGVTELMRNAQQAAAATFENLTAYSFAAMFYIVLVAVLQVLVAMLEHVLGYGRRVRI
jgi:ABC-type arginine transport system permease subunit